MKVIIKPLQSTDMDKRGFFIGAGSGTRTHTPLRITDFESVSSASSDTPAYINITNFNIYKENNQEFNFDLVY